MHYSFITLKVLRIIELTPRLEASIAVVIPVQPYPNSSVTKLLSKTLLPKPPAISCYYYCLPYIFVFSLIFFYSMMHVHIPL
jgi:hypothetical protein